MSEIESLIYEFNDMCGEPETEMGNLAMAELYYLRRFVQVGIEILEAQDKGYLVARDALIDGTLRRLIHEYKP